MNQTVTLEKRKKYSYCNKTAHHESKCFSKTTYLIKTNSQGPMSLWVPKWLLTYRNDFLSFKEKDGGSMKQR